MYSFEKLTITFLIVLNLFCINLYGQNKKTIQRQRIDSTVKCIDKNRSLAAISKSSTFNEGKGSFEKRYYFKDTLVSKIVNTYSYDSIGWKFIYSYYYLDNQLIFYSSKSIVDSADGAKKTMSNTLVYFYNRKIIGKTIEGNCKKRLSRKNILKNADTTKEETLIFLRQMKNSGNKFPLEDFIKQ